MIVIAIASILFILYEFMKNTHDKPTVKTQKIIIIFLEFLTIANQRWNGSINNFDL